MYPNGSCQAAPDVILKNSLVLGQHHQEGMRMRRHGTLSPRLVRNTVKRSVTHHIQSDAKASQRPSISHGSYSSMDSGDTRQPLMWNSVWLRRIVLLGLSLGCCCMTLATALLYHFSLENNGLSTQKQANHLGWKYGPTACEFFPPPANE